MKCIKTKQFKIGKEILKLANHKKFYPFYKYLIGKDKNEKIENELKSLL